MLLHAREAARLAQCKNSLKQLGLALNNYHDAFDFYPPGKLGNSLLPPANRWNWIHSILNQVEAGSHQLLLDYDKAWDDPSLSPLMMRIAGNWDDGGPQWRVIQPHMEFLICPTMGRNKHSNGQFITPYMSTTGLGSDSGLLPRNNPRAGMWAHGVATKRADVADGLGETIMMMESAKYADCWVSGGLLRGLETAEPAYVGEGAPFGGVHAIGAHALFADSLVEFTSTDVDSELLMRQLTIAGENP